MQSGADRSSSSGKACRSWMGWSRHGARYVCVVGSAREKYGAGTMTCAGSGSRCVDSGARLRGWLSGDGARRSSGRTKIETVWADEVVTRAVPSAVH